MESQYICTVQILKGFAQLPMLETVVPVYPLTDNVKKYIWHSIFSLILVFMNCFNFCKLNEWKIFLFILIYLLKIVSDVEHFFNVHWSFLSLTLYHFSIFLFIFPRWLLRIPCIFKVINPFLYVLQKVFLACFWLCACSSNSWNL